MSSLSKTMVSKLSVNVFFDAKSRSSFCWKYFGNIIATEGYKRKVLNPDEVYCSVCLARVQNESEDVTFGSVRIKRYSKRVSTGNLTRHLRDDHQIVEPVTSARRAKTTNSATGSKTPDKLNLVGDLVLWCCKSMIPFDNIFDEGMKCFFKKYNIKDYAHPSWQSVNETLTAIYQNMLTNAKEKIQAESLRHCALTFDSWTDHGRKLEYITFKLRYLTADFDPRALTLSNHIVAGEKTDENIASITKKVIQNFDLEGKVIHAVTAADKDIKRAVSLENMDLHLCLEQALHNLVTVDGISTVPFLKDLVIKCKKVAKTVLYSLSEIESQIPNLQEGFPDNLEKVVTALEIDEENPIQNGYKGSEDIRIKIEEGEVPLLNATNVLNDSEVPSRWHCILEMLECLGHVCNRDPVNKILKKLGKDDLVIVKSEWIVIEEFVVFLKRFREAIDIISSQKTCSINIALVFRCEVIDVIESTASEESLCLYQIKCNMFQNIDLRFPVTKLAVAAALLDKRFTELKEVDSYLESQGITKPFFLANYVKEIINADDLTESVEKTEAAVSDSSNSDTSSILTKLSKKHSTGMIQVEDDPVLQECWRYLATNAGPVAEIKEDNLLSYWNKKKQELPWLSAFARALLCVPATISPSERVFSISGMDIDIKRTRLNPQRLNKIVFIHDNLKECNV